MLFQQNRPPVQSDAASYQPSLQLNKLLLMLQCISGKTRSTWKENMAISGAQAQNSRILKLNLPHKVFRETYRKIARILNQRSAQKH